MQISFFTSSSFTIPILNNIIVNKNKSILEIFLEQIAELQKYINTENLSELKPIFWKGLLAKSEGEIIEIIKPIQNMYNQNIEIGYVITQPKKTLSENIKDISILNWATNHNILTLTPERINLEIKTIIDKFKASSIEIAYLASYGQIIDSEILDSLKFKFINWHPSKLPKYRGASPMQTAINNNDSDLALTWLEMTKKVDAGDIWLQIPYKIDSQIIYSNLAKEMAILGSKTWILPLVSKLMNTSLAFN
jgi:methionyl-tRNA formyltransferase